MFRYIILCIFLFFPYFKNEIFFSGYFLFFSPFFLKKSDFIAKKIFFIPYITIVVFALISMAVNSGANLRLLKLLIFIPFIFWSSKLVWTRLFKDKTQFQMLRIILLLGLMNSIFSILCLVSSSFSNFFYSIIHSNPKLFEYPIFRPSGLIYDGYSYASTLYSIFIIIALNYYKEATSNRDKVFSVFCFFVFLINITFLGRVGLAITLIYLVYFIFKNFSFTKRTIKQLSISLILLLILFMQLMNSNSVILNYFEWSTNFLVLLFDSNQSILDNSTINELLSNHFNFSMPISGWIFGSPKLLIYNSYDPGITRLIIGYGLVVTIIFFSSLFLMASYVNRSKKMNQITKEISIAILLIIILGNFKDFYVFSPYSIYFLFFLIIQSPYVYGGK